MNVISLFIL